MKVVDWGVAAAGGVASNVLVRLPYRWRVGLMHTGNVGLTKLMQTQAFRNLYLGQNKAHRRQVEEVELDEAMTAVPEGEGQQVSLFYSGGADSTYSAYLLAQEFDRVHLLSFAHDAIANLHKPKINSDRLRQRFGDKIVHRVIDGNDIWKQLYLAEYDKDLGKYGAFMNTGACECCYLSWNAIAVVYNKRNGISNLAVGIDRDHSGFMYSATDEGIEAMRRFHAGYGIHYFMPVYDEPQTDVKLYELGITSEEHTKRPYQFYTTSTTQGTCEFGLGHRLYAQYAVVRQSAEERQARAGAYFAERLGVCRNYIDEALQQDLPIAFMN
jgi:hypothetical protein